MRSCLLSPKFYTVVNQVLARMVSSDKESFSLRATILQFLNKIIKLDRDFVPLILEDIDLKKFLRINLFQGEPSGMQLVVDFLQNFQRDITFCDQIYKILIEQLRSLPEKFLSFHGNQPFFFLITLYRL